MHYLRVLAILSIFLCTSSNIYTQQIEGVVTNIFGEPLIGATVQWENEKTGNLTDTNGQFAITVSSNTEDHLIISYVGYKNEKILPKSILYWTIQLLEDNTLSVVDISAKEKATRFANSIAKVEVIGSREIERAACCSLAGCFSTNASVQSMTTNILTDSKELQILGLSGVYNQILVDGVPLVQGLVLPYGSGSYPGTLLEEIYISKGANSVLQGSQGISGQINIITKNPEQNPNLFLNAFVNSFGETQYNTNYIIKNKNWSNLLSAHLTSPAGIYDRNNDNYRDLVSTDRFSFYNKFSFGQKNVSNWVGQFSARYWQEERIGGMIDFDPNINQNQQNAYGQTVDINHTDITAKLSYSITDNIALTTINSGFYQSNRDMYGLRAYIGDQLNITSNVMMDYFYGEADHNLKIGFSSIKNVIHQDIVEHYRNESPPNTTNQDIDDFVPGVYVEQIYNATPFTIIAGIRMDRFGLFGWKTSPRLLIRSTVQENIDIRFSIGKGFRYAYPLGERSNILSNNRQINIGDNLAPEEAINIGLNGVLRHSYSTFDMTLSIDGYHTLFQNQVFPDFDQNISQLYIDNYFGTTVSNSFQVEQKFEIQEKYDLKWAYNYLDVYRIDANGLKQTQNFVSKHRFLLNGSYATADDQWQVDLSYRWTGSMQLPTTEGFPVEYQRSTQSPSFTTIDGQITKRWKQLEIYTGIENLFNLFQIDPILASEDPYGPYFNTIYNWGPIKGREIYLGIRWSFDKS